MLKHANDSQMLITCKQAIKLHFGRTVMMTIYHTFRDLLFLSSETTLQSFFQFLQDGCKQKANQADLLGVLVNRGFDAVLLALTNI